MASGFKGIDKEDFNALTNKGRVISENLLRDVVELSKDAYDMSKQVYVLRRAAINILAHEAFNQNEAAGITLDGYIEKLLKTFRAECQMLTESDEIEVIKGGVRYHDA